MKKFICMLIGILMLCISLAACQSDEEKPKDPAKSTAQTTAEPETTDAETTAAQTEPAGTGGVEAMYVYAEYEPGFYGIEHRFTRIIGQEAYEEWVRESGYFEGNPNLDEYNVLGFIKYFNISKEDFKAANLAGTDNRVFSDEQIEALYSDDKDFLARMHMNPRAININGDIYTPKWLMEHSPAEMKAVGITKEMLQEKYNQWVEEFDWGGIEISQNIKEKLDAWDAPVQDSAAAETQG